MLPEIRGLHAVAGVLPTVTGVDVAPDMRSARVFFSLMTGPEHAEEVRARLNGASGFVRHQLGKQLDLRRIPNLFFEYDASFDEGARMSRLIREAQASRDKEEDD